MRKYEFTGETKEYFFHTLHRIRAVRDFGDVKAGEIGGWIESESNLSHDCNCWVYDDAQVCGSAHVYGDAVVFGDAVVCGDTEVYGDAEVCGSAVVCGTAEVWGRAVVCGDAEIKSNRDYIVFKNFWSSGRYFTYTRSNNKWRIGCFYGTGEELIKKAYADSVESGREYERIVKYVESIINAENHERDNERVCEKRPRNSLRIGEKILRCCLRKSRK